MLMPPGLMAADTPAKRPAQLQPIGQLDQQRRPGMGDHSVAVTGDLKAGTRLDSLHLQGALLGWRM
jgi:hypothetical protein